MSTFYINLLIFLGCGLGGLCRYWASNVMFILFGKQFPVGTLFVNVTGSFLIGILFILILERLNGSSSEFLRPLLLIGFLGGYTTFSTFSIETINLAGSNGYFAALTNIVCNVVFCLLASWLGMKIGRFI